MESCSTVTLVNPTLFQLDFSKNSMLSAVLTSSGRAVYTLSTTDGGLSIDAGDRTELKDAQTDRVLATVQHRSIRSDTVTFVDYYEGRTMKLDKWLREVRSADGGDDISMETCAGTFIWRAHPLYRIALYSEFDTRDPIAYADMEGGPSLLMEPGTESFREVILVSFIVLEQRLRMEEKARVLQNTRKRLFNTRYYIDQRY